MKWTKRVGDYASTDGWSLVYSIRGATTFPDVTADPQSDGSYSVTIAADTTKPLEPGRYVWSSHAYKAGPPVERYPIDRGVMFVSLNLVDADTVVTHAAKMLPIIEAVIEGRVPADVEQYTIGGRQLTKIPIQDLIGIRNLYRAELVRQRRAGKANPSMAVAFVRPR